MDSCRICGKTVALNPFNRRSNGYQLYCCAACKTVLVNAQPAPEAIARVYDELFGVGDYAMHRHEFDVLKSGNGRLSLFREYTIRNIERVVRGRRMAEIGGGSGAFGVLARSRGWDYIDHDVSTTAVTFARQLGLRADVIRPGAPPDLPSESVDVVVMWEVIEHVWNVQEYLLAVQRALRPAGKLFLSTPNLAYQDELERTGLLSSPPLHVNFFNASSLAYALRCAGFAQPIVRAKRWFRPELTVKGILRSARWALGIDPSMTLLASATRPSQDDTRDNS